MDLDLVIGLAASLFVIGVAVGFVAKGLFDS